ncbi:hypothetical protein MUP46_02825 [Patescibacteria group bacterium]|nr:hypothetical protein [Patescibacteria group bacterium]
MTKKEIKLLLLSFLSWRALLILFVFLAPLFLTLQKNFLGGGLANYPSAPWFWSWLNFDGEHYLAISYQGYQPLTYFFFPLFPLLARFLSFGHSFINLAISGLVISNVAFLAGLVGLWKLVRLDYEKEIAVTTIFLTLLFPTSFYFGSYYTESLFFALAAWSFYFARKSRWFWSGTLGGLSSLTRILGLALFPALLVEWWQARRKSWLLVVWIFLVPLGLGIYMHYLYIVTGDPLNFLHTVGIFGAQRSSNFVLFPQVFYRYFFKILPSLNYSYFPVVFSTYLEIITAILFLVLSVLSFLRLRLSYSVYLALGFLIPSLAGSFSSFPRYALILFPGFLLMALWLSKQHKTVKLLVYLLLFATLAVATSLFVRGYWIA